MTVQFANINARENDKAPRVKVPKIKILSGFCKTWIQFEAISGQQIAKGMR